MQGVQSHVNATLQTAVQQANLLQQQIVLYRMNAGFSFILHSYNDLQGIDLPVVIA